MRASPAPRPGGGVFRITGGAGWGARYGTLTALGSLRLDGDSPSFSAGGELAIALKPSTADREDGYGSFAVVGRVLHGRDGGVRTTEIALGPGGTVLSYRYGPGAFALYATSAFVTDEAGRSGWSLGIELALTMPLFGVFAGIAEELGHH